MQCDCCVFSQVSCMARVARANGHTHTFTPPNPKPSRTPLPPPTSHLSNKQATMDFSNPLSEEKVVHSDHLPFPPFPPFCVQLVSPHNLAHNASRAS